MGGPENSEYETTDLFALQDDSRLESRGAMRNRSGFARRPRGGRRNDRPALVRQGHADFPSVRIATRTEQQGRVSAG